MALSPGTRLGVYVITAQIGEGGMGQVYRARDTKLNRDVALKVLPDSFANDVDRFARFTREAQMLAALNHPNIAQIHGLEDGDGVRALAMELVEGEDLSQRIARGAIPLDEALPIAQQIADAIEAAHERSIIHRDLKPANIRVRPDGRVKVLDFGLAKAHAAAGDGHGLSKSPTIMATALGSILGTPAYMSPEQAIGREADRGSDVWAFGCVLYEMLAGRRAFEGDTASEMLAGVLKSDPDWHRLPADTPSGIRRLLRRSLQKDQKLRWRDIRDARLEIDEARNATSDSDVAAARGSGRGERIAWATALALVALIAGVFGVKALRPARIAHETRLEMNTPPTRIASLAMSPDGLKMVFVAQSEGRFQLWLRSLDSPLARPLAGTEGALGPFWSPDSRSIAFLAGTQLKRMDIDGGSVQTLASGVPLPLGGSWNNGGTIIFGNNPAAPIFRVSATGGEPTAVTRVDTPRQRGHEFPQFLPDGRHFLFFVTGSPEARGVYVGQLDAGDTKRLFDADTPASYTATGQLLFVRAGKLLAQDFDPDRLELGGGPFPVAENVTAETTVSASPSGPIAYRTAPADSGQRQLVWVDRSGREAAKVVYPDSAGLGASLSHDGRRVAVYRFSDGNMDVWSYDTRRRSWDRVTFDPGDDIYPLWSPDDASIVSGSVRETRVMDLYRTRLGSGTQGSEERLYPTLEPKFPTDWSADGRFLLYDTLDSKRGFDIWALPFEGQRKPLSVVQSDFNESLAQFSPDGRWVAYQSDKTGRSEIYLRPFLRSGAEVRVSVDGGTQARWNPNGKELFYLDRGNQLMAVTLHFSADEKTVEPGAPIALFVAKVGGTAGYSHHYMVSPDGQSFVTQSVVGDASASPITVILNWQAKP